MNSFSFSMIILNLPSLPACIRDDEVSFFTAELFTFSAPLFCKCPLAVWLQIHYNSVSGSANYLPRLVEERRLLTLAAAVTSTDPGSFSGASARLRRSARTPPCTKAIHAARQIVSATLLCGINVS
ncbi:hypothetical protein PspLS_06273 [Pyricularia sp. CBS 133598]|nr:hypothetical protein PspLS_06273 [Pyricularia sp. CBS 133598]